MNNNDWNNLHPHSLQAAMLACLDYGKAHHNLSVERVADAMGYNHWTLRKWLQNGRLPVSLVRRFEDACQCPHVYVTRYLASQARKVLTDLPAASGEPAPVDLMSLQRGFLHVLETLTAAQRDSQATRDALDATIALLACQRAAVDRRIQPDLDFGTCP